MTEERSTLLWRVRETSRGPENVWPFGKSGESLFSGKMGVDSIPTSISGAIPLLFGIVGWATARQFCLRQTSSFAGRVQLCNHAGEVSVKQ